MIKNYKKYFQELFTLYQFEVYVVVQWFICSFVFLLFPTFEGFLVITCWLDMCLLFHYLYVLKIPIFPITAALLTLARVYIFLKNFDLFTFLVMLNIVGLIGCLWICLRSFEWFQSVKRGYEQGQEILLTHFRELTSFGGLNYLFLTLLVSFGFLYTNPSWDLFQTVFMNKKFSGPCSLLACLVFMTLNTVELLICFTFNTGYPFLIFNYAIKNSRAIMTYAGGTVFIGSLLTENALSGKAYPLTWVPGVRIIVLSIQLGVYKAHGHTIEEVQALKEFAETGGGTPPCIGDSKNMDLKATKEANAIRRELLNAQEERIKQKIKTTKWDFTASTQENVKRVLDEVNAPHHTSEDVVDSFESKVEKKVDPFLKPKDKKDK